MLTFADIKSEIQISIQDLARCCLIFIVVNCKRLTLELYHYVKFNWA